MTIFDAKKRGTIEKDVTYASIAGTDLKMDVYYPKSRGPWRGLIFIHGGAWSEGDKAPLTVVPPGFLVTSINYRLYPYAHFPAMIEDVKCAIRYLRAHAVEYNLDPKRIALIGHSAGGHLAALAGLTWDSSLWVSGPYLDHSSQVKAVVELSGPTDLSKDFSEDVTNLIVDVFGKNQLQSSSPVTYARNDSPSFLIVHGDADDVVPVEQATFLHDALIKAGGRSKRIILKNVNHALEPVNGKPGQSFNLTMSRILLFLMMNV